MHFFNFRIIPRESSSSSITAILAPGVETIATGHNKTYIGIPTVDFSDLSAMESGTNRFEYFLADRTTRHKQHNQDYWGPATDGNQVWFCSACGEGPYGTWYSACVACGHGRCDNCTIEDAP